MDIYYENLQLIFVGILRTFMEVRLGPLGL
jgi:hypothetical protein